MMQPPWRALLPLLVLVAAAGFLHSRRPKVPLPGARPPTAGAPLAHGSRPAPPATHASTDPSTAPLPAFLPPAASDTLALIARGDPFPHAQDGAVFGNHEHHLPREPRGYYHEYTVATPAAHNRGTRRIITGGNPPDVYYYTDDHYRSFRRFTVPP